MPIGGSGALLALLGSPTLALLVVLAGLSVLGALTAGRAAGTG
ncbi:MAG: hypothetical protein ACRDSR_16950 [Pseudonocardiaceae bacterium]